MSGRRERDRAGLAVDAREACGTKARLNLEYFREQLPAELLLHTGASIQEFNAFLRRRLEGNAEVGRIRLEQLNELFQRDGSSDIWNPLLNASLDEWIKRSATLPSGGPSPPNTDPGSPPAARSDPKPAPDSATGILSRIGRLRRRGRQVLARIGSSQPARIYRPPGARLGAFARFWFSRKTYAMVVEPTLRDLQDEYSEALAEGQPPKARWVRCRGTLAFWSAVVNQLPVSLLRLLYRLWKAAGS